MKITTAETAISTFSGSRIQACENASATPSSGASTQREPVGGSTDEAMSAMPRYGTSAASSRTPISRRSPARPIFTCPARPEDASIPLKATSTSGNANTRFSSDGDPATDDGCSSTSGSNSSASPSTTTSTCRTRSPRTSTATRSKRRGPPPRMASSETNSTIAAPIRNSVTPVLNPSQNRPR